MSCTFKDLLLQKKGPTDNVNQFVDWLFILQINENVCKSYSPLLNTEDDNEVFQGKQRQRNSTCQLPCRRTLLVHSAKIGCKSLGKPKDSYLQLQLTMMTF
jgi:hypothetical protein